MKTVRHTPVFFLLLLICMLLTWSLHAQVGKVGINTLTPTAMLHVRDSSVLFSADATLPAIPGQTPASGGGTRMMWYPQKAAFRAGTVYANQWDRSSIGNYSFSGGFNTIASGETSIALGEAVFATGNNSIAIGSGSQATGFRSVAIGLINQATHEETVAIGTSNITSATGAFSFGRYNTSSAPFSLTLGDHNVASNQYAMATGSNTVASGYQSATLGFNTNASNDCAIAMGNSTSASGFNSTSMGSNSKAKGHNSTAMGFNTIAKTYLSFAMGQYNDTTAFFPLGWDEADPIFVIGNGSANNARKNAFTVLKNGKTGINISYPTAMLHVKDSSVLFTATASLPASPGGPPAHGSGTRMMWYPDKAAFRVGTALADEWDKINTGTYSFACGFGPKASGSMSVALGDFTIASGDRSSAFGDATVASGFRATAMGNNTIASGTSSTSMGSSTQASGINSTAMGGSTEASGSGSVSMGVSTHATGPGATSMGNQTTASGSFATVMGHQNNASGDASVSMGFSTIAKSYASLVIGRYNDSTAVAPFTWNLADPVFVVGNGTANNARTNAMTILKNGRVGIATSTPKTQLQITGGVEADNNTNSGYLLIGETTTSNIVFDNNEIQGRTNGAYTDLNLQTHGGNLNLCEFGGNTGIGVTTPGYKLDIGARMRLRGGGTLATSPGVWFNKINNSLPAAFLGMFNDDYIGVYGDLGAGWSMVVGTSNGNVGIGTTNPSQRLVVSNSQSNDGGWSKGIVVENTGTTGEAAISFKNTMMPASKQWNFGLNETPNLAFGYQAGFLNSGIRMVIDTLGNVGIGITAPTQKLHVVGNGLFTGTVTASCGILSCSDIRYKTKLSPITNALGSVMELHGIYYFWDREKWKDLHFDDRRQIGFSAQEVEKFFPEMVYTDETGYKSVDYSRMTPVLLEAIKAQQELISQQESVNKNQQDQIDFLLKELVALKTQISTSTELVSKN